MSDTMHTPAGIVTASVVPSGLDVAAATRPVFTYTGIPRGQRYEVWREELCRRFCQLDVSPSGTERIECTVEVGRLGDLSFGVAHGTSGSFLRTQPMLSDGCDDLVLVTAVTGGVLNVQRGHAVELRPSQMSLISMNDIAESRLSNNGRLTALRMPRRDVAAICRDVEDRLSKPLSTDPAMRKVVAGYFALCVEAATSLDPVGQQTMARHMTELVGHLMLAEGTTRSAAFSSGRHAARLQLVKADVAANLVNGDVSIGSVATRTGISPKQVQRVFEPTGQTFTQFVLEQRLQLARRLLVRTTGRGEKIGNIAQDAGFGDLSYFNRRFRKRFGVTPSEWREAAQLHF